VAQQLGSNAKVAEVTEGKNIPSDPSEVNFRKDFGTPNYMECSVCQNYEAGKCRLLNKAVGPSDFCDAFVETLQGGNKSALASEVELKLRTVDLPFFIYRVSTDKQTGVRRWYSTASGVDRDLYDERMSVQLFKNFINRIEKREPVPEPFSSRAWNGGLPYLGVAHYMDLDGFGIVGDCDQVFVDGDVLKMRGTFKKDSKLADACYKAIEADINENKPQDERTRVSIAFVDWKHKHEGVGEFTRKSLTDRCPFCESGVGNKVYLDGQLVHLALTRRPAYPKTNIGLEVRAMADKKTARSEDALSIVGEELSEELEKRDALTFRSDQPSIPDGAIVIKKAPDEEEIEEEPEEEVEEEEMDEDKKKKRKKRPPRGVPPEGSTADEQLTGEVEGEQGAAFRSLGGAKTIDDANTFISKSSAQFVDSWSVLSEVLANNVPENSKAVVRATVRDFQSLLDQMAIKTIFDLQRALGEGSLTKRHEDHSDEEEHVLDEALGKIRQDFDDAMATNGTKETKLAMLQPAVNGLAETIVRFIQPVEEEEVVQSVQPAGVSRAELDSVLGPLMAKIEELTHRMAEPEKRSAPVQPVRRAIQASYLQQGFVEAPAKPSSLKSTIRRSVGLGG